jgi:hypothetical protein
VGSRTTPARPRAEGRAELPGARRFCSRRLRGERGASLVEFAIVLPLFILFVFGVIEFGLTFNNYISLRQGVREAAREGAVGNFGTSTSCSLTGSTGASNDIKKLMCTTKNQIGLGNSNTRVMILSGNSTFNGSGSFNAGDTLIICAMYPVDGAASIASPVLGNAVLKTKTSMRIETQYTSTETGGSETALSGSNWNWCTVTSEEP